MASVYIKKVEIYGFKSFPYKTIVELHPGITAIVGPNGAGKSNLLDAIK
ncbi:MAG: AAA family ATPase [Thermodesulfobacteriaceae bacterium]